MSFSDNHLRTNDRNGVIAAACAASYVNKLSAFALKHFFQMFLLCCALLAVNAVCLMWLYRGVNAAQ